MNPRRHTLRYLIGLYNADWQSRVPADDPRLLAVAQALDTCTAKQE